MKLLHSPVFCDLKLLQTSHVINQRIKLDGSTERPLRYGSISFLRILTSFDRICHSPKISPNREQPTSPTPTCAAAAAASPNASPQAHTRACNTTASPTVPAACTAPTGSTSCAVSEDLKGNPQQAQDHTKVTCADVQSGKPCGPSLQVCTPVAAAADVKAHPPSKKKSCGSSSSSDGEKKKDKKKKASDGCKEAEAARRAKDVVGMGDYFCFIILSVDCT